MSDSESTDSDQTVPISIRKRYRKWLKERRNQQILGVTAARGFLIKRPALIGGGRGGPMHPYVAASPPPPPPPSPRDMHAYVPYVPRDATQLQWLKLPPPQIILAPAPETTLRLAPPAPPAAVVGRGQAKPKVDLELKLWF